MYDLLKNATRKGGKNSFRHGLLGNKSCVQLPGGQIHQDIGNFETSGSKYQRDEIRFDLDYWENK